MLKVNKTDSFLFITFDHTIIVMIGYANLTSIYLYFIDKNLVTSENKYIFCLKKDEFVAK
jgi:hypothetical protein